MDQQKAVKNWIITILSIFDWFLEPINILNIFFSEKRIPEEKLIFQAQIFKWNNGSESKSVVVGKKTCQKLNKNLWSIWSPNVANFAATHLNNPKKVWTQVSKKMSKIWVNFENCCFSTSFLSNLKKKSASFLEKIYKKFDSLLWKTLKSTKKMKKKWKNAKN